MNNTFNEGSANNNVVENNNITENNVMQSSVQVSPVDNNNSGKNNKKKWFIIISVGVVLVGVLLFGIHYSKIRSVKDSDRNKVLDKAVEDETPKEESKEENKEENNKEEVIESGEEKLVHLTKAIKVKVQTYKTEEGGRNTPIYNGFEAKYEFNGEKVEGKLLFSKEVEKIEPGESVEATLLLSTPADLKGVSSFNLLDGNKKIGEGTASDTLLTISKYVRNDGYERVGTINQEVNRTYDGNGDLLAYTDTRLSTNGVSYLIADISRGTVKVGDTVQVLGRDGSIINTEVVDLLSFSKHYDSATTNDRINIGLKDVPYDFLTDQMAIYKPGTMIASNTATIRFKYMTNDVASSVSLKKGEEIKVVVGRSLKNSGGFYSMGEIVSSTKEKLENGEEAQVTVRFKDIVAMEKGMSAYILNGYTEVAKGEIEEF